MGSIFDILKKAGAALVILVLILMMGLLFSSQPIEEITSIFTGSSDVGEFEGEVISARDYSFQEESCRNWINEQKLGQSEYFLKYCIQNRLRQSYALSRIGKRLAFEVSPASVKKEILAQSRLEYASQQNVDPDDKWSLGDIYRQNLSSFPLEWRGRQRILSDTYKLLSAPFPVSPAKKQWEKEAKQIKLSLRLLYFRNEDLRGKLKAKVRVSSQEIQERFEKEMQQKQAKLKQTEQTEQTEQKAQQKSKTKLSADKKKSLREEIQKEKVTQMEAELHSSLKALIQVERDKKALEKIAAMTAVPVHNLGKRALSDLGSLQIGKDRISLFQKDFIKHIDHKIQNKALGPLQSGAFQVYVEILKIHRPTSLLFKKEREPAQKTETKIEADTKLSNEFLNYLIEQESKRGNFTLYEQQTQQAR